MLDTYITFHFITLHYTTLLYITLNYLIYINRYTYTCDQVWIVLGVLWGVVFITNAHLDGVGDILSDVLGRFP